MNRRIISRGKVTRSILHRAFVKTAVNIQIVLVILQVHVLEYQHVILINKNNNLNKLIKLCQTLYKIIIKIKSFKLDIYN